MGRLSNRSAPRLDIQETGQTYGLTNSVAVNSQYAPSKAPHYLLQHAGPIDDHQNALNATHFGILLSAA